jgi:Ca-activated chloride channel family protein
MILALARPVKPLQEQEIEAESIEIALVMDLSSSMLAMDFEPNRLEAAKTVARSFVEEREYDLFTLVAFAAESYTVTPLTSDSKLIISQLASLECGHLEDGTAIGMGLATALNRLKQGKTKNKVVILLTDGVNNAGYIQPLTAAALAEDLGYKVYTIGVGSMGEALSPVSRRADGQYLFGYVRVEIDEELLKNISSKTGGQYFRATDVESLKKIYDQIDELEKTKIQIRTIMTYKELYRTFVLIALLCIVLDLFFRVFLVKRTY